MVIWGSDVGHGGRFVGFLLCVRQIFSFGGVRAENENGDDSIVLGENLATLLASKNENHKKWDFVLFTSLVSLLSPT